MRSEEQLFRSGQVFATVVPSLGKVRVPPLSIIQRLDRIRPFRGAQARLATFLEREYLQVPFLSVGEIAVTCEVGKATVSRFVQRLGYESFSHMRRELRSELYVQATSPAERHSALQRPSDTKSLLTKHRVRETRNVRTTLGAIDPRVMSELCADLARAERVCVFGERFSYGVAFNLALLLQQLLADARIADGVAGTVADTFSALTPNDHVVLVAQKRIGASKARLADFLVEKRVPYSVLTDVAPEDDVALVRQARHVLRASAGGVGAFTSYTSTMALAYAVATVLEQVAPTARRRLTNVEVAVARFRVLDTAGEKGGGA